MKDSLRRKLLEIRKHYKYARQDSLFIAERFLSLQSIKDYQVFLLYYPHKNEVDTTAIIERLIKDNKTVLLPKVYEKHILPIIIDSIQNLHTGYAGIKEPKGEIFRGKIDVIVVPAIAFDKRGYRLGYGKGFYDRFLQKHLDSFKIGLAYDFQLLDELPIDQHDVPVDMILTPTKIVKIKEDLK